MSIQSICATGNYNQYIGKVCGTYIKVISESERDYHIFCITESQKGFSVYYGYVGAQLMTETVCGYLNTFKEHEEKLKEKSVVEIEKEIYRIWEKKVIHHHKELSPGVENVDPEIVRRYECEFICGIFKEKELILINLGQLGVFFHEKNKKNFLDIEEKDILELNNNKKKAIYMLKKVISLKDYDMIVISNKGLKEAFYAQRFMFKHFLESLEKKVPYEIERIKNLSRSGKGNDIAVILWRKDNERTSV